MLYFHSPLKGSRLNRSISSFLTQVLRLLIPVSLYGKPWSPVSLTGKNHWRSWMMYLPYALLEVQPMRCKQTPQFEPISQSIVSFRHHLNLHEFQQTQWILKGPKVLICPTSAFSLRPASTRTNLLSNPKKMVFWAIVRHYLGKLTFSRRQVTVVKEPTS